MKGSNIMANGVNPDQTAPSSLIWVYTICSSLSVRIFQVTMVCSYTYIGVYSHQCIIHSEVIQHYTEPYKIFHKNSDKIQYMICILVYIAINTQIIQCYKEISDIFHTYIQTNFTANLN